MSNRTSSVITSNPLKFHQLHLEVLVCICSYNKTLTKTNLGRKQFKLACISLSLGEVRTRTQEKNLEAKTETTENPHLLACSLWLARPPFLYSTGVGTAHSGPGTSTLIITRKCTIDCLKASPCWHFPCWGSFLPYDFSLCQVDKDLTSTLAWPVSFSPARCHN